MKAHDLLDKEHCNINCNIKNEAVSSSKHVYYFSRTDTKSIISCHICENLMYHKTEITSTPLLRNVKINTT
jgi:hypothetical protein